MAKFEVLRNGFWLLITKIIKAEHTKPVYEVVVQEGGHDKIGVYDGVEFPEEAWAELEQYFQSQKSGIIWRAFTQEEQDEAWKPRFSGMNPQYIRFARMAWDAAFEYVNDKIRSKITQEDK